MENPLSKIKKAYGESDFALKRQLKKETKGLPENFDALQTIQEDDEFAQFLVDINPGYANMDLQDKKNIQIVREKYVLFTEQKALKDPVAEVYTEEVVTQLGIELPKEAFGPAKEKIGEALRDLAQKNTMEFQNLRNKLLEYQKVKAELGALEEKFMQKVGVGGKEGEKAMKDRQVKLEQASGKVFSKEGATANFGRIWGNTTMEKALTDLKHSYGQMEKESLGEETTVSKADLKKAEEMRAKLQELRAYLLQDLKIGEALIEATQAEAKRIINAKTKDLSENLDRFDVMSKADRLAYKTQVEDRARRENWGVGMGPAKEEAELARIAELNELDDLEEMTTVSLSQEQKTRLGTLRSKQEERAALRLAKVEAAHKLITKMAEGKGKKGGIDYTKTQVVVGAEGGAAELVTVRDLLDPNVVGRSGELVKQLEQMVKDEVKLVIERAAVRSPRLEVFKAQVEPYMQRWQMGGLDSRDSIKSFMTETIKKVCQNNNVSPVLKVQIKAFMAQRGMNISGSLGGRYEAGGFSHSPVLATA